MSDLQLPPTLTATRDGDIAILRLSRAAKRNALDDETVLGLRRFFMAIPAGVGAVVLHGEGDHFSAGLDLSEVTGTTDVQSGMLHSQMWHKAFHDIQFGPVPVICVLHGAVVGGGLELASSTHIRVAERSAFYGLPEGQRGIFLGGGGSVRITRLIGVHRVQYMMLTGHTLSAEEGHVAGISQVLVENGQGLAKGIELARKVASNAAMSNYAIIQALPRIAESDPASGFFTESLMAAIAETTPEAQQRVRAFLEKRAAKMTPTG